MPAFDNLLIVVAVAFAAPLLLGFFPSVKLPSVVLEILAGIVIGLVGAGDRPHRRGDLRDLTCSGLPSCSSSPASRSQFDKLRGQVLRVTVTAFIVSFAIAILVALLLKATGLIETPLLIAIILCATSLGVLIPVLKDAGEISSTFGQLTRRGGDDRRLRRRDPALDLLLGGGRGWRHAAPDRQPRAVGGGRLAGREDRGATPACSGRTWSASRTRPPRFDVRGAMVSAGWASPRSPTRSGWNPSSGPSWQERSSPCSTRTSG